MECLLEQEVDTVFGYPGGTILNLYDELYHYQDKIHHVLTAHEQGAAHAADGYARSTGKVGVCFATSGPGATNLTTGIATAYMDSSPVVFITCNVSEGLLGKDSFQEVDITGIAMPITKATYLVRDPQTIPDVMRQAVAVAATGRPGPVLIDFLKNVTFLNTMIDYEFIPWDQNRGTDSIRPVSYTHLHGVQRRCRLPGGHRGRYGRPGDWLQEVCDDGPGDPSAGLCPGQGLFARPGSRPVSYTHLDVYKRQELGSAEFYGGTDGL